MMKGIHTFKGPQQPDIIMQPVGFASCPFPSLVKRMEAYLKERRNIRDLFCVNSTYADRPITSPFKNSQEKEDHKSKEEKEESETPSKWKAV